MNNPLGELPIGFGMQLAKNLDAMNYFSNLDEEGKRQVVNQTKNIGSKQEMEQFVSSLADKPSFK